MKKDKFKETHRGIVTTRKKINEKDLVTITNRFKQLSVDLPRIDDVKRWAGYPGLTGVSRRLSKILPTCTYYIEPFAGTAKVYQALLKLEEKKFSFAVLNDNGPRIFEWLKKNFTEPIITCEDFTETIRTYDHKKTLHLIDGPWNRGYYEQYFSCFNRLNVKEYDLDILKECEKITGSFIITSRKENMRFLKAGYNNYLIQSEYVVSGRYPKVMLTTNLRFDMLEKWNVDLYKQSIKKV